MKTPGTVLAAGICCLSLSFPLCAGEEVVFTWVDAEGVTHFSETPPQDTTLDSYEIRLETPPAAGPAAAADHYSVINQAQRMQQSRLEAEKVKTRRLQAEAEARRATADSQPTIVYEDDDSPDYYPVYPYYGYRPGYRPGYKPGHRPGRPVPLPEPGRRPVRSRPISALN